MWLDHLQAAEFLYETRLFPEREFTFKHALTHEVAYSSLLQERRRGLHARIVEVLEDFAPDHLAEQVDRLAHHAFRGAVWDKALTYSRQAGARAAARSAHREAIACLSRRWQPWNISPSTATHWNRLLICDSTCAMPDAARRRDAYLRSPARR